MVDPNTRQAKRTPVTLKIKFKSATLEQFIERYAVDVSHGGIFIRTKEPLPVGTQMRFEFQLRDATPLITGEGTVVWTRENDPARPGVAPGMGVRFDRLGDGSQEVLDKILAQKAKTPGAHMEGGKPPAFNEVPTKVAPSPLVGALAAESKPRLGSMAPPRSGFPDERTDATPLPKPMPFHSDVDDFPEEAFEEATKVRSLDELVAQTAMADLVTQPKAPAPEAPPRPAVTAPAPAAPRAASPAMPPATEARPTMPMAPPVAPQIPPHAQTPAFVAQAASAPAAPAAPVASPPAASAHTVADELAMRRAAKNAEVPRAVERAEKSERNERSERAERSKLAESSRSDIRTGKSAPVGTTRIATPLPMPETPRSGEREPAPEPSRTPIGIIAALVVVAAAAAAVWFFVLRKDATQPPPAAGSAVAGSAATTPADPGAAIAAAAGAGAIDAGTPDAAPAVPAETVDVVITSNVKGASVSIDDTAQAGPAPLTAKLEKGKTYDVVVTAPGHQPARAQVGTDQRKVDMKLTPLPHVVRVTSTPAGAHIYVDGRDTKMNTPADVPLSAVEVARSRVTIGLRKVGFEKFNEVVAKTTFGESEGKLLASLDAQLQVARVRAPAPDRTDDGPATTPGESGGTPSEGTTPPAPSETPSGGTTPTAPPLTTTPKPEPKVEPKPAEPKPAEPKPAEPKGSGEPTPDWMKP